MGVGIYTRSQVNHRPTLCFMNLGQLNSQNFISLKKAITMLIIEKIHMQLTRFSV